MFFPSPGGAAKFPLCFDLLEMMLFLCRGGSFFFCFFFSQSVFVLCLRAYVLACWLACLACLLACVLAFGCGLVFPSSVGVPYFSLFYFFMFLFQGLFSPV